MMAARALRLVRAVTLAPTTTRWRCRAHGIVAIEGLLEPMVSLNIRGIKGSEADAFTEALLDFGASSSAIEDAQAGSSKEQKIYSHESNSKLWSAVLVSALFKPGQDFLRTLTLAADASDVEISRLTWDTAAVPGADWVASVKAAFKPTLVAHAPPPAPALDLWIVPEWCDPPDSSAVNVVIEPGLAFGTGDHPTTRLCLRWLHARIRGGESVLDWGCGSGILALAAIKLGAARATAVDIEPQAVTSAHLNAGMNDIGADRLQLHVCEADGVCPTLDAEENVDIVCANILIGPLLALAPMLARRTRAGGRIGLSGVLLQKQAGEVVAAYSPYFDNLTITSEDDWALVEGVRRAT